MIKNDLKYLSLCLKDVANSNVKSNQFNHN